MTDEELIKTTTVKFVRLSRVLDAKRFRRLLAQIGMLCIAFEKGQEDRSAQFMSSLWDEIHGDQEQWPDMFE